MSKQSFFIIVTFFTIFFSHTLISKEFLTMKLEHQLAQKIILDLRYYCPELKTPSNPANQLEGYLAAQSNNSQCTTPLTHLPTELAELIKTSAVGGIILFADNLVNTEQIVQLTSDLQNAALTSATALPLFISIDQEGGRVVRLPRHIATSFSGNMAIGASYSQYKDHYAKAVGKVLGKELNALGFNVNYAPNIDVNVNPNNPVINVRSFGENPQQVATLGIAMLESMQAQGVIATLKHFPGHGDTNVDSHTGLPQVNHDIATVEKVDLYPFQQAILHSNVEMIMTAHIQYPALDDSTIVNKAGESMIRPATLSKKILSDLLRKKMRYQGLILTDALDMAGISHFFTPIEAVIETFKAGADIAVMPIKIRTPADIEQFKQFIEELVQRVKADPALLAQVAQSTNRIKKLKQQLNVSFLDEKAIASKKKAANKQLANVAAKKLEKALALDSIVEMQNNWKSPHTFETVKHIVIVFPEKIQAQALQLSIERYSHNKQYTFYTASLDDYLLLPEVKAQLTQADLVITASDGKKTAVDLGGIENLADKGDSKTTFNEIALHLLRTLEAENKKTVFISLHTPYHLAMFKKYSDRILVSFNGNAYYDDQKQAKGAVYDALALFITQQKVPTAKLPVSVNF